MTTAPIPEEPPAPSEPAKAGPRAAPLALWRIAEAFLRTLHALFGAPEDVARRHTLTQKPYALMLSWLRAGEALLRRLLLIEAFAHMATPNAETRLPRPREHIRKPMGFYAEAPEAWRVSFRCIAEHRHVAARASRRAQSATDKRFQSAWPLAERYEALLRVFNDPTPYARRLARRLRLDHQRAELLMRAAKGAADMVGAESWMRLGEACVDAFHAGITRAAQDTS